MMKKKLTALLLAAAMMGTLVACGGGAGTPSTTGGDDDAKGTVYAVEAGSAGEKIAQSNGYEYNAVTSQADTLMEVSSGTSDAAIIDLLMAGAMIGEGTSYPNLTYTDSLTEEVYGVGCRKDSDLTEYINNVFCDSYADGTLKQLANTYKIPEELVLEQGAPSNFTPAPDGDVAYIQGKGKLIVGITDFAPIDYQDENGEWIGFDADMAKVVAQKLGVEVEFVVIDWDNKVFELDAKDIDVVWNGMTLTDEVKGAMSCTNPYLKNEQVIVVPAK